MSEIDQIIVVRQKYSWKQFEILRERYEELTNDWTNGSYLEKQADGVTYLLRANIGRVDAELRVLTGGFIHQVRSTLDNLAWALAMTVSTNPGRVSFPICKSSNDFGDTPLVRLLAGSLAAGVLEQFQPYVNQNARCLFNLHKLWNVEKHRMPVVLPAIPSSTQVVIGNNSATPLRTKAYWRKDGQAVENGAVLARIVMPSPAATTPRVRVEIRPALEVSSGRLRDRMLPHALFDMWEFVYSTVGPGLLPSC